MAEASRHDAWQAGDRYEAYMGRWSRRIAPRFLDWLGVPEGLDWLEVGCGTGALSAAILERCNPKSLISIDPSEGFVAMARAMVPDSLEPEARQRLKERLEASLPRQADGSIPLKTRAWAVRARVG
jgi:SAM-dependent methyltransferase